MSDTDQLSRVEVAALAGIEPKTLDKYRERSRTPGVMLVPEPDGYIGRSPWWYRGTARAWISTRRTTPGNTTSKKAADV